MQSYRLTAVLALLLSLVSTSAQAFFDPPYITPLSPIAGQMISVNIRGGICDTILDLPGYPKISQQGNAIRIVFFGVRYTDPILCNIPIGEAPFSVGAYPAGAYTLQVDLYYFDMNGDDTVDTLGIVPFTVTAAPAPPVAAPTLDKVGLGVLVMVLAGCVAWATRKRGTSLLLLTCLAFNVHSQSQQAPNHTIEVLLTTAKGAPTAQQLVDNYARSPAGPPPLQAFAAVPPAQVSYLLPIRAQGDFLARLQANPDSVRAKLERYVLVQYSDTTDLGAALSSLHSDPYVASAQEPVPMDFSSVELQDFGIDTEVPTGSSGQYGRDALNIDAAWQVAGGYALVADIDSGLYMNHPALQQFDTGTSTYRGGNFIPIDSLDVSLTGIVSPTPIDANVDERKPAYLVDPNCPDSAPVYAGHGTHTSGLIGANGDAGLGVEGTCKHCGIAMWKVAYALCSPLAHQVLPNYNAKANAAALTYVGDGGAQVVSMSFGGDRVPDYCSLPPPNQSADSAMCLAIEHATARDVVMVAASGNQRQRLQFPANDDRVIAAGGFDTNIALWDESPGNQIHCPYPNGVECGSNYTSPATTGARQELMGSAKAVRSTTYPGYNWNTQVECGDQFPGPGYGNGVGNCTGTSMSSPQVAGVVGLVRSINPLVPTGKPTFNPLFEKATLRWVLAITTAEAQANQGWTATFGYGHPDAAAAARKMLGKVDGVTVRNRVTPLFRLYSAATHDYADTSSPQTAAALMINAANSWQPPTSLPLVPNYGTFPHGADDGVLAAPRASVYVMTTEFKPRNEWPALVPLYLMDKEYNTTPVHTDYMLVTTVADIQQAHADGYNLRNIQGYIYQPCTPAPGCIPPGAKKLLRACDATYHDCATFLETEASSFASAGYTTTYPPISGTSTLLGYAYPATDTDHDGLPDGFEYVVGTDPTRADSDNDGSSDSVEFPMVGVPLNDPCSGGWGARYCGADIIFKNGFD